VQITADTTYSVHMIICVEIIKESYIIWILTCPCPLHLPNKHFIRTIKYPLGTLFTLFKYFLDVYLK